MSLDGVLALDKPAGITSHDVVQQLRRLSGQRRIGHAGTLDPLATGLLLLCFGRSTRLVEYLIGQPKAYTATIRLGQTTDTYDADGTIVDERPADVSLAQIESALAGFRGTIQQLAPVYSAIKRDGQPLYKRARRGEDVERPSREVTFYDLRLISWEEPWLVVHAHCSSGTYIRSLAHDLGKALGCGGHIAALRRTAIGPVTVDQAVPLADLTPTSLAAALVPGHTAVSHLPRRDFSAEAAAQLLRGQRVPQHAAALLADGTVVRAYAPQDLFLGIVIARGSDWQPHKMFHSHLDGLG